MKAAAFDYLRPDDLKAAIGALGSRDGAKPVGGAQSLGPMLNLRLARPSVLVGLGHLQALTSITDEGDAWRIGAAVTHATIEDSGTRLAGCTMLAEVARDIAYRSVRNRGTIGGSLVHADPAADWPLCLVTLGASIEIEGPAGTRRRPLEGFMRAAFTVALDRDEVLSAVLVPKVSAGSGWSYFKFCRKPGDFAQASAALLIDPPRRIARLFVGALDGAPAALPGIARQLAAGETLDAAAIDAALAGASPGFDAAERRMRVTAVSRAIGRLSAT